MRTGLLSWFFLLVFYTGFTQTVKPIKVSESNAGLYRDSLNTLIFGAGGFPYNILPDSVIHNVNTIDYYNGYPYDSIMYPTGNLDSVDHILVSIGSNNTDFPSKVSIYLFHPHNSNGKLFIYHSGHCAGVAVSEDILGNNNEIEPGLVIPALIAKGYTVLAVPMINYKAVPVTGLGCGYNNHDELFNEAHYEHPLSLYFTPLIASLNYLDRNSFSSIYMCGLSGGGWTTSIYPAIDSSVSCSFPVAGSWPMAVREVFHTVGDYEQTYPPLFAHLLDYHEIYTLSCLAPARKMLQINNRYDECCFAGPTAHIYYVDSVAKALNGTNGMFKFYLDETGTAHAITSRAVQVMLTFIANENAVLHIKPADSVISGTNYFYDIKSNFYVNNSTDSSSLRYSLLKAPSWLQLDTLNGTLHGMVPPGSIVQSPDSISFKAEDSSGRFVVYNYNLVRKKSTPYFFTKYDESKRLYFLLPFSHSLQSIDQSAAGLFFFNNPQLAITSLAVENNSFISIELNMPIEANDSIGYNGYSSSSAITYSNGSKLENFGLTAINLGAVTRYYAVAGMIRFNSETKKFEYFNGTSWVVLN